jgi:cysteine-rich repeat protein
MRIATWSSSIAKLAPSLALVFLAAACTGNAGESNPCDTSPVSAACLGGDASSGDASGGGPEDDATTATDGGSVSAEDDASTLPPAGCGDGERAANTAEECDDGNTRGGDGCDARCLQEPGYNCAPKGGACETICGDGLQLVGDTCDDG